MRLDLSFAASARAAQGEPRSRLWRWPVQTLGEGEESGAPGMQQGQDQRCVAEHRSESREVTDRGTD
jgi:hypothetical protein